MYKPKTEYSNFRSKTIRPLLIIIGISLFFLPLLNAWLGYPTQLENNYSRYSAIGGIVPYSDASAYYNGANIFLDQGRLDISNTRRPINALLYAVRLWISNNNFHIALILQTLLCGIASLILATSIFRQYGKVAGITTFFILFVFASAFIPTALSETLGLTLGCLGFALLWNGIQMKGGKQNFYILFGSFVMTMGLNARAGAFFTLPFLMFWLIWKVKKDNANQRFNFSLGGVFFIGIILGFIFNLLLVKLYGSTEGGALHSNLSHTVYGLVAGGKGWKHAYSVFSDLPKLENDFANFIYLESFKLFLSDPTLLFKGLFQGIKNGFINFISFFLSQPPKNIIVLSLIRLIGLSILIISFWRLIKLYKFYPLEIGFLFSGLLGIIVSAGVIWDDGGLRVFAASVPFVAVALGLALASFFNSYQINSSNLKTNLRMQMNWALFLSGILIIAALIFPKLVLLFSKNKEDSIVFTCPNDEVKLVTRNINHSPNILLIPPATKFRKSIGNDILEKDNPLFTILKPEILNQAMSYALIYDHVTHQVQYVIAPPEIFKSRSKLVGLCGKPFSNDNYIIKISSYFLAEK